MPVAAIAMIPAPENWISGTAARIPTTRHAPTGVCRRGATRLKTFENGSWLSRDMPKQSLIVAARIDRQQTKIAAVTTSREIVANGAEKVASMTWAGPQKFLIA